MHPTNNLPEDDMSTIEMRCCTKAQEELRAIGVWTTICHRQNAALSMHMVKVLIVECISVDGFTTSAILMRKVAALGHEARNHPMEDRPFEVQGLAAGGFPFLSCA